MLKNFINQFLFQVSKNPTKSAIIFGEEIISYKEADLYSDALASYILEYDIGLQKIIPLIIERDITTILAMLGILKAGCSFLPISPITPCSRIKYILNDTKAKILISNINLENIVDFQKVINPKDVIKLNLQLTETINIDETSLAYVMYTSGSTGNPKGVLIEHRSMMNLFESIIENLNIHENDYFLALTDYTFDISLIELLLPLLQGSTIVLTEQGAVADGGKIKKYLDKYPISFMQATPLTWEILIKQGWKNNNNKMRILVGGEKFKTSLAEALNYENGNVWNMYGPTETSMWSLINNLQDKIFTESVPIGYPIKNTFIKILDSELNEVSKNVEGDLYIGGWGLARGYLNNQELTNERFIYYPQTGERIYKTGDLVINHENQFICYVGRSDDQLKFGGIRIEAGEIESYIEQEPFVKKAVVKIHEKDEYYKTLAAYIEIDEDNLFSNETHAVNFEHTNFVKNIYDEIYTSADKYEHGKINNCGWQSSFTGKLFSHAELEESEKFIKNQILNTDFATVLEIGCGTGGLLLDYIDKVKKCTIVEISIKSIEYISKKLSKAQLEKIKFINDSIVNIHDTNKYSCIIINSVLQYLQSAELVISTIKKLISLTSTGGTIFLGDIRSKELMEICILEKIRINNPNYDSFVQHLKTFYYKSRDSEITLSPKFFYALQNEFKEISYVDINVKHGSYVNELNFFRYDVVLHINKDIEITPALYIDYSPLVNLKYLSNIAVNNPNTPIVVKKIPNIYIRKITNQLFQLIKDSSIDCVKFHEIINQEDIKHLLCNRLNFSLHNSYLNYNLDNPYDSLDLFLFPIDNNKIIRCLTHKHSQLLKTYYREPFNPWIQRFCFEHIKLKIKQNILSWVMPSVYVWIEKWPATINGKLDKKKLELPSSNESVKKESETIENLQNIWRNITGDDIFLDKEFWVHGVSSLSMYFFLSNINEFFLVNIQYHEFKEYNTLEKLADRIEQILEKQKP